MHSRSDRDTVEAVAQLARCGGLGVAVAESLTCGVVTSRLGRGSAASEWLRGGVIAYSTESKRRVLGVTADRVVSARCAEQMAAGVAQLLHADVGIATTGVGGPDPEEDRTPGTVYIGWWRRGESGSEYHEFCGDPAAVLAQTLSRALSIALRALQDCARV